MEEVWSIIEKSFIFENKTITIYQKNDVILIFFK